MLLALKLHLRVDKPAPLPPFLGRAVHAAILARLAQVDADLATALHDGDGAKPLTCSDLLGRDARRESAGRVTPGAPYAVRVTAIGAAPVAGVTAALLDAPPTHLELDGVRFVVTAAQCDAAADPWTGRDDLAGLAARYLGAADPLPPQVTLDFASPTTFRSRGSNIPLPLPDLVWGSLVERWNAFSPLALSPDARRFGAEMVVISRYNLRSVAVGHKGDGLRIGGVGQVTYRVQSRDRYWLAVLHLLAEFARFSGVGSQTSTGMGQARAVGARAHPLA